MAGLAHKRLALAILVRPRGLADEHPLGMAMTDAENRLGARGVQGTLCARAYLRFQLRPVTGVIRCIIWPPGENRFSVNFRQSAVAFCRRVQNFRRGRNRGMTRLPAGNAQRIEILPTA